MLEFLTARFSASAVRVLSIAVLVAVGGFCFWRGMAHIGALVADARASAFAERDAHWRAEIAASNIQVEAERRRLADAAAAADQRAASEITALQKHLLELETRNAALPNGDGCGLGRDRVRLLNR